MEKKHCHDRIAYWRETLNNQSLRKHAEIEGYNSIKAVLVTWDVKNTFSRRGPSLDRNAESSIWDTNVETPVLVVGVVWKSQIQYE